MDAFVTRRPRMNDASSRDEVPPATEPEVSQRSAKRLKIDEIPDSESDDDENFEALGGTDLDLDEALDTANGRPTDFENSLPASQPDAETMEEYERFKLSQSQDKDGSSGAPAPSQHPLWARGRSSIYVDAFNLALDTVLEEESHLFDDREREIFLQWRALDYQAQFMYVRLFLRKTDSWHRISRLGYYADVADPESAIEVLQQQRPLPKSSQPGNEESSPGIDVPAMPLDDTVSFADASGDHLASVEETAPLLSADELKQIAREGKIQGKNKAELIKGITRMSREQASLMSLGLSRHNSRESETTESSGDQEIQKPRAKMERHDSNREQHFLGKMLAILGPCVRLSPVPHRLFERVHLVFYRSTEWTEKSLTTIILAKIARRNFPGYVVCRTSTIFASRAHLLEFEKAIKLESEVDRLSESPGLASEEGLKSILQVFETVYPRWKELVAEEEEKEQKVYEAGEGAYLRRFTPAHSYTRIIHKTLSAFARLKDHAKEHDLLTQLLEQRLFHMARRGAWYQRKAMIQEHYMPTLDEAPVSNSPNLQKKHWLRKAAETCEAGLQDPDCHLTYHYDLQKRLIKLEKKLRIPRRLQHDFGHVRLADPVEMVVEGIQLKRELAPKPGRLAAPTRTVWVDEVDSGDECSVEEMCLSHFRSQGWKGYHAEGGIVRTLFAYLFYDVLFLYIPNVFQTAYQTCPLDLYTDAFYPARASEINHRLVQIANGEGQRLVREVWEREHDRRTSVVGLDWDFAIDDITELVSCFEGSALAAVCKVMAQEYRQRGGGIPDLILWRPSKHQGDDDRGRPGGEVMFAEVKSVNDRLSDTQRLWVHVLTGAGIKVVLCNAVAKEVREVY